MHFAFAQVHIYKNDYNAMCTEVYKHQHIETGGNLFGLWTTSGSAIIHVMLGPGQNCKRTSTSFHQDLEYMARVGRFVNDNFMLCHIGEWHSHHNLSLSKPSAGDESTIRRNFPQGMSKFLVIIANIRNGDTIKLSPYFFTDGGARYEIAEYEVFDSDSPFSTDDEISSQIYLGAEGKKAAPIPNPRSPDALVNLTTLKSKPDSSPSDSLANKRKLQCPVNIQNMHPQTADQSLVKPHSPDTSAVLSTPTSHSEPTPYDEEEPMDTDQSDLVPPGDFDTSRASHEHVTAASQQDTSVRGESDPEKDMIVDEEPQSERKVPLDQIHDHLKYWFGFQTESKFKYETSKNISGADEITFKHNFKYWMVRFPKDFPSNPAKLFYSYCDSYNSYNKFSDHDLVKPLTNKESILLSIKKNCRVCKICKQITTESVVNPRSAAVKSFSISLNDLLSKLDTCLGVNASNANPVCKNEFEITFKHANKCWIIALPIRFPDIPAKVYYLPHESSFQRHDVFLCPSASSDCQDINTTDLIIQAIQSVE